MNIIKDGVQNSEVIIQEGVPTIETVDNKTAESLIYLIGGKAIGCTYRVNEEKDNESNLNSSGMSFKSASEETSDINLCKVRALIAELATLSAHRECYENNWVI